MGKCNKRNCPLQYNTVPKDCDIKDCPYRTESIPLDLESASFLLAALMGVSEEQRRAGVEYVKEELKRLKDDK